MITIIIDLERAEEYCLTTMRTKLVILQTVHCLQ
nr:MAG TPA: hypothetical protein [Caudoviricetes sp.]